LARSILRLAGAQKKHAPLRMLDKSIAGQKAKNYELQ
jgi:hypothetical protein